MAEIVWRWQWQWRWRGGGGGGGGWVVGGALHACCHAMQEEARGTTYYYVVGARILVPCTSSSILSVRRQPQK